MKKIIGYAVTVIGTIAFCFVIALNAGPASKQDLNDLEKRITERVEILETNQDTIKNELNEIECDIDSLKKGQMKIFNGQKIIYEEVKKRDSHFWDNWF